VYGYEITKLDVYQERYLVGRTSDTVLFGDLVSCSLSEIPWAVDGSEKFYFENEKVRSGCRAGPGLPSACSAAAQTS
jgi:intraflagellar transport protein 172